MPSPGTATGQAEPGPDQVRPDTVAPVVETGRSPGAPPLTVGPPAVDGAPTVADGDGTPSGAAGMAGRIAGAAALMAVLTVASRLAGLARTLVFSWTVGPTDLGDVYQSANTVPNIIFEMVAGGALAGLVVPLLAGAVQRGDRAAVARTASAVLTWTVGLLIPLALLLALFAGPLMGLLAHSASPQGLAVGTRMLRVFAPQLPLYGVGIVLAGVLQAHRRFAWPVIAPLLSSIVVMAAYAGFAVVDGALVSVARLSTTGELVLSVGTTLGVAALSLCLLIPLRRLGLRLRPSLRMDDDVRSAAGRLALAGVVVVVAQQAALGIVLILANRDTPDGSYVLFTLAQTVFLLPWAVLAVPIATSAYPVLAGAAANGDLDRYRATLASGVRSVVIFTSLGAAALIAVAAPAARILVVPDRVPSLAAAITAFAPGVLGYGLFALLSRALYARTETRLAGLATVTGWAAVIVAALVLAVTLPPGDRPAALAAANSIGMTVLGAALLVAVARRGGGLSGLGRALLTGVVSATAAAGAGLGVRLLLWGETTPGRGVAVVQGMLSGAVVLVVFIAVAYLLDRHDTRPLLTRLLRRAGVRVAAPTRHRTGG